MASERGSADVADFMEEVQKYDCLYNKFSKNYKNKYTKMNCWRKIADKFDMSPEEAEKKFKNIRTAYGRYLKKVKAIPSGSGRDAVPVPKEFLNLDWLAGFISTRPCVSNLKSLTLSLDNPDGDREDGDGEENITELGAEEPELDNEIQGDGNDLESPTLTSTMRAARQALALPLPQHHSKEREAKKSQIMERKNTTLTTLAL